MTNESANFYREDPAANAADVLSGSRANALDTPVA
jgi:hypothetical protein